MRSVSVSAFIVFMLLADAQAQQRDTDFKDRFQYAFGTSLEIVPLEPTAQSQIRLEYTQLRYAVGGLVSYNLFQQEDRIALNAEGGFQAAFGGNGAGYDILLQAPVYLVGRIGAGCTVFNEWPIGVGLGLGSQNTYSVLRLQGELDNGSGTTTPVETSINQFLLSPSAMAEIVGNFWGGSMYALRFHLNLLPTDGTAVFDSFGAGLNNYSVPIRLNQFGIGVYYWFN
jgi:hypothetical protein